MLGAPCSPCCGSSCACPSWCSYRMILSNPDTCPRQRYGNTIVGFPDCSSPVPAYVSSPFTCSTSSQTASASVKGGATYQVNGQYIFFAGYNSTLFNVVATDDIWSVRYPLLLGTASGGISGDFSISGGPNNRDALRSTNGWSASVRPFCSQGLGDVRIQLELSFMTTASTFELFYRFGPTRTEVRLVRSYTRTRSKIVTFNTTCVSDYAKWCFGEVIQQFRPLPNPFTGWLNAEETSYGNWDADQTTVSGNQNISPFFFPIDQQVNFEILSRDSCNELP